jgi:serpin B
LTKLAEEIERRFDIEVQIDSRALNEASIPETLELSIDLHDVALVSALNAALRFDKLTWGIWDESLWITTESEADQHLTVIIYNVADLGDTDGDETSVDFEVLTDAISTTVAPNSWDTVGGPGSIAPFSCSGISALVISQTWKVHLQIGNLLADLRKVKMKGRPSAPARPAEKTGRLTSKAEPMLGANDVKRRRSDVNQGEATEPLVQSNNRFAIDLYHRLRRDGRGGDGNLFFSPYSISTAMGMAYAGSRGKTAEETAKALHFNQSPEALGNEFARLNNAVAPSTMKIDKFRSANRLWGDSRFSVEKPFVESIKQDYGGDLEVVDFNRPALVAAGVNEWVSKQTEGMIEHLLDEGSLNPGLPLVLINAVYFHGKWKSPFSRAATQASDFHGFERRYRIHMMHAQMDLNYASFGNLQMLELPYQDSQMSMLVLLPKQGRASFAELELQLPEMLDGLMSRLKKRDVMVSLPKFALQEQLRLEQTLAGLGIERAFDERLGDFSGITSQPLWIAALIHQAKVEVDEEGTRAAAVTGGAFGGSVARPTLFEADRPFVFMIRHRPTGQIVFLGRLTQPEEIRE